MGKKKFSLDKENLYQKIMPTSAASAESAEVLDKTLPIPDELPSDEIIPPVAAVTHSPIEPAPADLSPASAEKTPEDADTDRSVKPPLDAAKTAVPEDFIAPIPEVPHHAPTALSVSTQTTSMLDAQSKAAFPMPINLVEEYVINEIESTLIRNGNCSCKQCQMDAAAVALNKIQPKYLSPLKPTAAHHDYYYAQNQVSFISAMILSCNIVASHPHHDVEREQPMLHNAMELLVYDKIMEMQSANTGCQCPYCQSDIAALMLNALPPLYVVTSQGVLFSKVSLLQSQYSVDLTTAYLKAAELVHNNPRHPA